MSPTTVVLVFSAFLLHSTLGYPWHASCEVTWTFDMPCSSVNVELGSQIEAWEGAANCEGGGQRCLYELISQEDATITGTHTTPVKRYVDDLTFTFTERDQGGCSVLGNSRSRVWYAVLDYGTNYCNLHNLITGAGLDTTPGYTESTSDSICTQYTSANCDVY